MPCGSSFDDIFRGHRFCKYGEVVMVAIIFRHAKEKLQEGFSEVTECFSYLCPCPGF